MDLVTAKANDAKSYLMWIFQMKNKSMHDGDMLKPPMQIAQLAEL